MGAGRRARRRGRPAALARRHAGPRACRTGLANVAVLDLPDMDSVERTHRERVEELLPRVDAVAWVTDPEKYHDAVLHDDFLRAGCRASLARSW